MTRASIPWNVNQVCKAYANGSLVFDNAIQRGYVWDNKRASLLVDSVLRGFTIPPIYTIRTNDKVKTLKGMVSVYSCIDGKQRCTALFKFLNNEFALEGLAPFVMEDGTELDMNGLTFAELDEDFQDTFKSYGMSINYFTDITDEEVSEMMSRLNNGKVLTGVENARIKAKNINGIIALAQHPLFTENFSEASIKGYVNEEVIVKLYLLLHGDSDLSSKNVRVAYEHFDISDDGRIKQSLDKMQDVLGKLRLMVENKEIKKSVVSKILSKTNLVTILHVMNLAGLDTFSDDDMANVLAGFFDKVVRHDDTVADYMNACSNGTMRCTNVEKRSAVLGDYFDNERAA